MAYLKNFAKLTGKKLVLECLLNHFSPMFHFYNPLKCQKIFCFLTFSGGIEMEHCAEMIKQAAGASRTVVSCELCEMSQQLFNSTPPSDCFKTFEYQEFVIIVS